MSATRDIRSPSLAYKRDKDHNEKWSNGTRPLHGIRFNYNATTMEDELIGGNEISRQKVRPQRSWTEHKTHANKTAKPSGVTTYSSGRAGGRISSKNDAIIDANEATTSQLSKSLLELLPQHTNNTIQNQSDDILYSFDNLGPSPGSKGREVGLGGLIDMAEKKWDSKITDKILKSDYEVLDSSGETTTIKKKSPKQRAKTPASELVVEDDGFELI